jgi:hypothetical protein
LWTFVAIPKAVMSAGAAGNVDAVIRKNALAEACITSKYGK